MIFYALLRYIFCFKTKSLDIVICTLSVNFEEAGLSGFSKPTLLISCELFVVFFSLFPEIWWPFLLTNVDKLANI